MQVCTQTSLAARRDPIASPDDDAATKGKKVHRAVTFLLENACGLPADKAVTLSANMALSIAEKSPTTAGDVEDAVGVALREVGESEMAEKYAVFLRDRGALRSSSPLFTRRFTREGEDVFARFQYRKHRCLITHHVTGEVRRDYTADVPATWSDTAADVLIDKYLRKGQVPDKTVEAPGHDDLPAWLRPREAAADATVGGETSVRQTVHRIAGHLAFVAATNGYCDPSEDEVKAQLRGATELTYEDSLEVLRNRNARAFYDELVYSLLAQLAAPNSPQWFNTGLWWAYGTLGSRSKTHWYVDLPADTRQFRDDGAWPLAQHNEKLVAPRLKQSDNAFQRVQAHACFIVQLDDTMTNGKTGITDWWQTEAQIFKYGSGSGTNISNLRARKEKLSGGGFSSGPMSFIRVGDAVGGTIKSGGTTRRAAKIVSMDADHPDVSDFIGSKSQSEVMVASMICGSRHISDRCQAVMDAVRAAGLPAGTAPADAAKSPAVRAAMIAAAEVHVPSSYIGRAAMLATQGVAKWPGEVFDNEYEGPAYAAVPHQHANYSVRLTQDFYDAVDADKQWRGVWRKGGTAWERSARQMEREIAQSAWMCGDPGVQYHTNINDWNTSAADGVIRASNPCQPAHATVITHNGLGTMGELEVGQEIWTGKQWSRVVRKTYTGVKPVFRYQTTAGFFLGTADHKVISEGERVRADDAATIDRCAGPGGEYSRIDVPSVLAGLFVGDGSVHEASGDLMYLCVGEKDGDVLRDLGSFLVHRPGIKPYAWTCQAVADVLSPDELPLTYARSVPARFKYGRPDVVRSFLRGLYSANGSVCGTRITLKAASFQIISDVQEMLSVLGIPSYYTTNKPHRVSFPNGEYDCRQSYDLNITVGKERFLSAVGFIQGYKQQAAAELPEAASKKKSYAVVSAEAQGDFPVWDITVEADEHTYWTGGMRVSNCGEFNHLDGTGCNLASLNLLPFLAEDGTFDLEGYLHTVDLWQTALDVTVQMSHLPESTIAVGTFNYRDTGLGYGNLGALLMCLGLPYDGDEGRAVCGAVTALLHARADYTSARLAARLGAYPRYWANREHRNRVARNHAAAVDPSRKFEGVTNEPAVLDKEALLRGFGKQQGERVWRRAVDLFRDSIALGEKHGYRNAQTTLLAPTGTISFVMDMDTTGVEPAIALRVNKTLAGGGTMCLENRNAVRGLRKLGYDDAEAATMAAALCEGREVVRFRDDRHRAVFDTSFPSPADGRFLPWEAHVKMVAAAQPFLAGAISKTTNMPSNATVDEVARAYRLGNDLGLKAIALYRDGSKLSQPLNVPGVTDGEKMRRQSPYVDPDSRMRLGYERRPGIDVAVQFGDGHVYLKTSCYPDGRPGEIWATYTADQGIIQAMLTHVCKTANVALQHGVPLDAVIQTWKDSNFAPSGPVGGHPYIKFASSLMNLIGRLLAFHVLGDTSVLQVQPAAEVSQKPGASKPVFNGGKIKYNLTGESCPECGSEMYVQSGANCKKCKKCGFAGGCG